MLKYVNHDIVFQEFPDEVPLAINLSLCPNGCPGCHSAYLQGNVGDELTEEEADVARRGRNAQAKHAAPKHADPADYSHATGLEALWGYLYIPGQNERLCQLMADALERTEELWHRQSSK